MALSEKNAVIKRVRPFEDPLCLRPREVRFAHSQSQYHRLHLPSISRLRLSVITTHLSTPMSQNVIALHENLAIWHLDDGNITRWIHLRLCSGHRRKYRMSL